MNQSKALKITSLEEFYECAGFSDYYERILKPMTNKEMIEHWFNTFEDDENTMAEEMNYWCLATLSTKLCKFLKNSVV